MDENLLAAPAPDPARFGESEDTAELEALLRTEEAQRLMKDKGYLEGVYRAGAEKAEYIANKTLRKVYKKVGFLARF